jgi:hypothetical protein
VSRYKLDEYLQLFDFPSPNLSAEQRFTTNVPLQRLFFMNSDFVQQQAEQLAKRVAGEAETDARIQKAYRITLGRAATPAEVKLGVEYLNSEPLNSYEDRKAAAEKEKDAPPKPKKPKTGDDEDEAAGAGMMAGVKPGAPADGKPAKKPLLPVTAWGRYMKVLLSSNEFLFIN